VRNEQTVTKTFQARFGSVVRSQRLSAGFSQEELAHRSGLHRTYVTDVERGARNPSLNSIKKLSGALGVSLSDLFRLVESSDQPPLLTGGTAGEKENSSRPFVEILIADNDPVEIESTLSALKRNNLANTVHFARDGSDALDFVFCTGPYKKRNILHPPDLVVLDLELEKIDGLAVLDRIRQNPITKSVAVVALVSPSNPDIGKAQQLGISGLIVKPLEFSKLVLAASQTGLSWALVKGQ
jgi:CheY-like chemotaxis protein/DNA-binding XRE family transcriptional regulator